MNTYSSSSDSVNDDISLISAHIPQESTYAASEQDHQPESSSSGPLERQSAPPPNKQSALRGILTSIWPSRIQDKQAEASVRTQPDTHDSCFVTVAGGADVGHSWGGSSPHEIAANSEQRMGPSIHKTQMQTNQNDENEQHSGQVHSFFGRLVSKLDPFAAVNALFRRGENLSASDAELDALQREQLLRDFQERLHNRLVNIGSISSRGGQAQKLVDLLQTVLDSSDAPSSVQQTVLLSMQQILGASGHYPSAYSLTIKISNEDFQASGTLGDVYRIRHKGQMVRVKKIAPVNSSRDQLQALQRIFTKECLRWGLLLHPNVLPFYGFCEATIWPSVASPWMDSGDITQYLKAAPSANRHLLSMDVANGLRYLHMEGVVHGDLKGSNILVDISERARIADYGLTLILDSNCPNWATHLPATTADEMYRWRAPELLGIGNSSDQKDIHNTKEGDVYAWACVCYMIFVGDIPFHRCHTGPSILAEILDGRTPEKPPSNHGTWSECGLNEDIWSKLEECWIRDPTQRPSMQQITRWLGSQNLKDTRPESPTFTSPSRQRLKGRARPFSYILRDLNDFLQRMELE